MRLADHAMSTEGLLTIKERGVAEEVIGSCA